MTTSPLASPSATRALLETYGLATKHRLGQNFLIDNHVIERIMSLAELGGTERVLEVGPGIGTLTLALVQEAPRVVSIEMDGELEPVLRAHAALNEGFSFIMGDALAVPPAAISEALDGEPVVSIEMDGELEPVLRAHAALNEGFSFIMGDALAVPPAAISEALDGEPEVLVANLPYNVAATIILQFFQTMPTLRRAVVMVQKEVADRIAAQPGTKAFGAYTAKLGLYGSVTGRFEVPPRCFMPAPHVDSAVVRIDRRDAADDALAARLEAPGAPSRERVSQVLDAAFAQRRKTIRNSMSAGGFDKAALDEAFASCGIAPTVRAEALGVERFVELAMALDGLGA